MEYKVVFNDCYGGFSISLEAVYWLEENCKDNELRDFIKSLRLAGKEYSFASKDECLCYNVSSWFECKRHHKDLVAVVEALRDTVNGPNASLKICTIYSRQCRIDYYDGAEEVITPDYHRDWIIIE